MSDHKAARPSVALLQNLGGNKNTSSFTEKLDAEALAFFNEVSKRPFAQQAVAFLNAYWPEVKDEAEFIYSASWEVMKYADMHAKGIQLIYKYEEGHDLDFDIGLYFYEQLNKFVDEAKNAKYKAFARSQPEMMTSLKRKQELRDKVDVNFDGRIGFLEYLLYQYKDVANPADFCHRSMNQDEHPEIRKARLALEEVNKKIRAYEEEKARLTEQAAGSGVKALGAKNMLAQIDSSPLRKSSTRLSSPPRPPFVSPLRSLEVEDLEVPVARESVALMVLSGG